MKERGILFSAPMVRALLDGTKTQTRRIACFANEADRVQWVENADTVPRGSYTGWVRQLDACALRMPLACPYGVVGDRLYVRERFAPYRIEGTNVPCRIEDATYVVLADGTQVYRDGTICPGLAEYAPGAFDHVKFRPGIHMPRWASRITLEITNVRVERLQSISTADAMAEGVEPRLVASGEYSYTTGFHRLWDSINGKRPGCSWKDNPWLWAIAFKRIEAGA